MPYIQGHWDQWEPLTGGLAGIESPLVPMGLNLPPRWGAEVSVLTVPHHAFIFQGCAWHWVCGESWSMLKVRLMPPWGAPAGAFKPPHTHALEQEEQLPQTAHCPFLGQA